MFVFGLAVSWIGVLASLYGALFGPHWFFVFGILGFLLAVGGCVYSERCFVPSCLQGLVQRFPWCRSFRGLLTRLGKVAGFGAAVALVTMFLSARLDGVPDGQTPVFAPLSEYVLTKHGKRMEISKLCYWTIGTSFSSGGTPWCWSFRSPRSAV